MFFFFFKNKQIIMVIYSPVEYLLANYDLFQPYIYFQLVALILTLSLSLFCPFLFKQFSYLHKI